MRNADQILEKHPDHPGKYIIAMMVIPKRIWIDIPKKILMK
jgi:hypothetical protein